MASAEVFNITNCVKIAELFSDNNESSEIQISSIKNLSDLKDARILNGIMFDETFDLNGDNRGGALEENGSLTDGIGQEQDCKICHNKYNSPKVLSCLHVFCESCLDKRLIDESGDAGKLNGILECPICMQTTKVGNKGAASLHSDYILTNILDLSTIEPGMIFCTSCKSKENAISRCNDCANFLCAGCDNAHQYMRCFENHEVVKLEAMQNSTEKITIHKPLYCNIHTSENLKYYCFNCQIPVCNDCLIADHKGTEHHYEIIGDAEKRTRNEIEGLKKEATMKMEYCDLATGNLDSALQELQTQHDTARGLIEESFQSFKALLEKRRDQSMRDLKKLHSDRVLKIMDILHNVEKSSEKFENACNFTKKVLDQANGPEILSLKKMITSQFLNLINNTPKADVNYSIEFDTKYEKFEQLIQESFGKFRTESTTPKESTPPPTLPGMPPILISKNHMPNGTSNSSQGTLTGSVTASSPISLPTSMQSSFDGDISALGTGFMLPSNVLAPESPQPNPVPTVSNVGGAPSLPLTSIAEYNLHRLANLAETSEFGESIVPPTQNSTPQFTLADLLSGDQHALNNLQALAKLGLNNPEIGSGSLLTSCPSSGIDLLNDYTGISSATSPIISNGSVINEELSIQNFQGSLGVPGRGKATPMQIRCKFGSLGASKSQFNSPHGFCLGVDEEIIVADTNNHRIEVFEKTGSFKFHFGVPGKEEGQLWYPRKVAVMRPSSKFVVCDRGNERSRMQIFTKNGHFIKKIAIRYIDIVAGLAVTQQGNIVAVDSVSPTVFIISEEGDLVHWFDCSDYMREPSDIAINGNDFYVCDFKGHCVVVFSDDGTFKSRIGCEKITCFPNGIDISDAGDVLIGDSHGNRFHVACYSREGILQSEFECPYVKVSRCCGLKITSEGYVVTLAKNNHHVLVLNTLYIQ